MHCPGPRVETDGCGDSFAAGVSAGLSAGWNTHQSVVPKSAAVQPVRFGPQG